MGTTRRTTAVRDQLEEMTDINSHPQTGAPGRPGGAWLLELSRGNRSVGNSSAVSLTAGWAPGTLRRDTPTLNVFKLLQITQYHSIRHITTIIIHFVLKCIFLYK